MRKVTGVTDSPQSIRLLIASRFNEPETGCLGRPSKIPVPCTRNSVNFQQLSLFNCPQLITIPCNLSSIQRIEISSDFYCLDGGRRNERMYCPSLDILVDDYSETILILVEDLLEKCSKSLRYLRIWGLYKLCYFPTQLLNLNSLEKLEIESCINLRSFFQDTETAVCNCLMSLKQLHISRCHVLRCLPKGLLQPTLDKLELEWCSRLTMTDPDEFCSVTSLQDLKIKFCPGLAMCWGEGLFCISSLRKLEIGGFSLELDHFPWPSTSANAANVEVVQQCPLFSLESLSICDGESICLINFSTSLPLKSLKLMVSRSWKLSRSGWVNFHLYNR